MKILILDATRKVYERLSLFLEPLGFETLSAVRGDEVAAMVPEGVSLCITAEQLSDMDAFAMKALVERENPYFHEIPFLICVSRGVDESAFQGRCLEAGFKGMLSRPFNRVKIIGQIQDLLVAEGKASANYFADWKSENNIGAAEKVKFINFLLALDDQKIVPKYAPSVSVGYAYPLVYEFFSIDPGEGHAILDDFTADGVLAAKVYDKVNTCPKCSFHTLNFREICPEPECLSLRIFIEEVLHHFACGYVGPARDFKNMVCPKCGKTLRHIGLDYEKMAETYACRDCDLIFTEPGINFRCLTCGYIGMAEEARVVVVNSYRPTRKAQQVRDFNSLYSFDFEQFARSSNMGCFTPDFLKFMLERECHEATRFNEPLALVVFGIEPPPKSETLREFFDYLDNEAPGMDVNTLYEGKYVMAVVKRRAEAELAADAEAALAVLGRITEANRPKVDNSGYDGTYALWVGIRFFKRKKHLVASFAEDTLMLAATVDDNQKNGKVFTFDENVKL